MSIDPFRGSAAVATGMLTRGELRGPRFRRLFPDIYVPVSPTPPDLLLRSRAAALLVAGRAVLAGYSAAEVLGASCGPADAPAEVTMLEAGCQSYRCRGLRVRRDLIDPTETGTVDGIAVTSPVRTAFDLARWAPNLMERVVAVDALAYRHRFVPESLMEVKYRHLGAHGSADLPKVVNLADARSESPMESRIRMALVMNGLPAPSVQHPVSAGGRSYRLDLAYPHFLLAIEYDGETHRSQRRAHRDLIREAALVTLGWTILRFEAALVLHHPHRIAAEVGAGLRRRGW